MAQGVSQFVRGKVSKSKRRYIDKQNGFDLDLSYIVENRIIAMGFPSEGVEAKYRNAYTEVIKFLDLRHKDHFKVYNLCSERGYDPAKFYNRVGVFPFEDHNAPPFELIEQFCQNVKAFLDEDEKNVAVVHCKAGKGRTGMMICSYMLYENMWETADESMTFYAAMRTYNRKGVTIPSQIRYIRYFEHSLKRGMPPQRTLILTNIILHGYPKLPNKGELIFSLISNKVILYKYDKKDKKKKDKKKKEEDETEELEIVNLDCGEIRLNGDIKAEFDEKFKGALGTQQTVMFTFWFSIPFTAAQFPPEGPYNLIIQQPEIDKAHKDKNHKIFPKGFKVELQFKMSEVDIQEQEAVYAKHSATNLKTSSGGSKSASSNENVDRNSEVVTVAPVITRYSDILSKYPSLNNY